MPAARPKFVEGAGFYKTGAIVEHEGGAEYIRCSMEKVQFDLCKFARSTIYTKDLASDGDEVDVRTEDDKAILRALGKNEGQITSDPLRKRLEVRRIISGEALVSSGKEAPRFNGKFCFSAFGSTQSFQKLTFYIREDAQSSGSIYHWTPDPDFGGAEGFGIELTLDTETFQEVWGHVASDGSEMILNVSLGSPHFYAEWSPMDEGRPIKYLGHNTRSLENYDDLPEYFQWAGPMKLRFNLSLVTKFISGAEEMKLEEGDKNPPHFGFIEDDLLSVCAESLDILRDDMIASKRILNDHSAKIKYLKEWILGLAGVLLALGVYCLFW